MLCPYLHVDSPVEVPPGDYDVLHVTSILPCRILMQASVEKKKYLCAGEFLSGFGEKMVSDENSTPRTLCILPERCRFHVNGEVGLPWSHSFHHAVE